MQTEQKLIKIGNSYGVLIPKKIRERLNIKAGDEVYIDIKKRPPQEEEYRKYSRAGKLKDAPFADPYNSEIDPEFEKDLQKFNKKYKKAFQNLANK